MRLNGICFVFLILIFYGLVGHAQSKIDTYISKIDNSQFVISHGSFPAFTVNSPAAYKLIKKGKHATNKLMKALDDSSKTIIAHFILCHINFKHVSFAGPKTVATNNGTISKYYLGEEKGEGLTISESENRKLIYVEPKDREKIKIYWEKRLKN